MKKIFLVVALLAVGISTASAEWKIAGDKIRTEWAEKVNPSNVLPEYPRPQLVRGEWQNLNGLWNYAITDVNAAEPSAYQGCIVHAPGAESVVLQGLEDSIVVERDGRLLICKLSEEQRIKDFRK